MRVAEHDIGYSEDDMEVDEADTGEMDGFLNDAPMSVRSSQSGYRGPGSEMFEDDRSRAAYDVDPHDKKGKKRVRNAVRKLAIPSRVMAGPVCGEAC
jgi:hypothetical protein